MTSADFSRLPFFDLSPIVAARFVTIATGGESSRDKIINFPCVLPDLLYGITVDILGVPNPLLGYPSQISLISGFCSSIRQVC